MLAVDRFAEIGGEPEYAALAFLAFHADLPAHGLRQFLADRESQSGAAVAARCRGAGLIVGLKQPGLLFGRKTDAGVGDFHVQPQPVRGFIGEFFDAQDHLAGMGEFDGVAKQVDDDLPQTPGISAQAAGHVVLDQVGEREPLGVRLLREQGDGFFDAIAQIEFDILQLQLAGLDFGEIQQIVDQGKQAAGRGFDDVDVTALLPGQIRFKHQVAHSDDAVNRSAQLVTHLGEEIALGLAGKIGLGQRLTQRLGFGLHKIVGLVRHAVRRVLPPHGEQEGHGIHGPQRDIGGLGENDAVDGNGIDHEIADQQGCDDDAGAGDIHAVQGVFRCLLPQ